MAIQKEKSTAEAGAIQFTEEDYNRTISRMQESHTKYALEFLWKHGEMTSFDAFNSPLHDTRISATIGELRHRYGVPITTEMVDGRRGRYGVYRLERSN